MEICLAHCAGSHKGEDREAEKDDVERNFDNENGPVLEETTHFGITFYLTCYIKYWD